MVFFSLQAKQITECLEVRCSKGVTLMQGGICGANQWGEDSFRCLSPTGRLRAPGGTAAAGRP
jgi:hypothetical protein